MSEPSNPQMPLANHPASETAAPETLSPDAASPSLSEAEAAVKPLPAELPLLPLRNVVLFPHMMAPLVVARDKSVKLVEEVLAGSGVLGLVAQKNAEQDDPAAEDLHQIGCAGTILKML